MTHEFASTFKNEIADFLRGNAIWESRGGRGWLLTSNPRFYSPDIYAIADKWEGERKAFAAGRVIEVRDESELPAVWLETPNPMWFDGGCYRIKPKQWFEAPLEPGRLCWVSHTEEGDRERVDIIMRYYYRPQYQYFEGSRGEAWEYAIPLTNEELSRYSG